jgi:DNA primase
MINRLGVSKVILAFDMDTAGQNAKEQAIYSLQNLLSLMHIYAAEWHPKLGKDMGDLSLEARQQILDDAEMITFW